MFIFNSLSHLGPTIEDFLRGVLPQNERQMCGILVLVHCVHEQWYFRYSTTIFGNVDEFSISKHFI